MFTKILIANRGEIACRVIKTAHALGIETVAVFSDADADALHVKQATQAVHIGESPAASSYLNTKKIIDAAVSTGAQAIHPGYGFLSENPDFVDAVSDAGLTFIGPSADAIRAMGLKDAAKKLMTEAGVPVVPGYHGENQDAKFLEQTAGEIGYPVLIKARAGGGGKGMRLVKFGEEFETQLASAVREAEASFGDPVVLLEKYISSPRHIEVQVFADAQGHTVHLYERDCSLQRRHQKVIEEAPAPGMSEAVREAMTSAAVTAASAINYTNAGTIEFIVDGQSELSVDGFWFMEMNTRLQVEHPVTEAITGVDLVEWQLRVAAGESLPLTQSQIPLNGHSVEARVYAEDPNHDFLPVSGIVHHVQFPNQARIDSGVVSGSEITPFYDPMIAKIVTHSSTRETALAAMQRALHGTHIAGIRTNIEFLSALSANDVFQQAAMDTGLIEVHLDDLLQPSARNDIHRALASIILAGLAADNGRQAWRLWGNASFRVAINDAENSLVHRVSVTSTQSVTSSHIVQWFADEHDVTSAYTIELVSVTPTTILYCCDGVTQSADYVQWESGLNGQRQVSVKTLNRACTFSAPDPLLSVQDAQSASGSVSAPMTGVIRVVNVQKGQQVLHNDTLLVLEAMKMETALVAPRDGTVSQVHCGEGDSVSDGQVLVEFESEPED